MRSDARKNRQKILDAAESVFARHGPGAPTEAVARKAGVAVGTVFRHFPTKEVLVEAVLVERVARLTEEASALAAGREVGDSFYSFLERWAELAAEKRSFADVLTGTGTSVEDLKSAYRKELDALHESIGHLLERAQAAGDVRRDLDLRELMALMVAVSSLAEHTNRAPSVRARALSILFDGLRARSDDDP